MTVFYTIVGFAPQPFAKLTNGGHGYNNNRPRTYDTVGSARSMRTRLRNEGKSGIDYRILRTTIFDDSIGGHSTDWVD